MNEMLAESAYFGVFLSLLAYCIGMAANRKFRTPVLNPMLIAVVIIIAFLYVFKIDYETYNFGAKYLTYFLTPSTVCFAIPLHQEMQKLKDNKLAIACGIVAGAFTSMLCVLFLAVVFNLTHEQYVTLLPKSITTAIGMDVSTELGGITTITVAVIIITGVFGNIVGEPICKLFHITEPVAKGVGMGSSAHAIGTAKAMEMGEVEGAISSLSIAVTGLLTVIAASIAANLY